MECKYCGAQLAESESLCPVCGKEVSAEAPEQEKALPEEVCGELTEPEVTEETAETAAEETEEATEETTEEIAEAAEESQPEQPAPKGKILKIVLVALACGVLLAALVFGILYGFGFRFGPAANDLYCKENYCVGEDQSVAHANKVVATLGDYKLTNAQLQIFYWNGVYTYVNSNYNYLSFLGLDPTKPLAEQVCYEDDSMTWQQFFLQNALDNWTTYARLCMLSKEENYVMDEELKTNLANVEQELTDLAAENGYENAEKMLDESMGKASTVKAYSDYMNLCILGDSFYAKKSETFMPADEDLEAYFTEHAETFEKNGVTKDSGKLVDVRHILLQPANGTTDENGNTVYTETAWKVCLKEAEGVYNGWLNGEKTEEYFASLAGQFSQDGGSSDNGGLYTQVAKGDMVEEFDAWIMDETRKPGDHGLVKTQFGYHIMYYVGDEAIWEASTRVQMYNDRVAELADLLEEKWTPEFKYKRIALSKDIYS